jgi:hypothetical protein
MRVRHKIGQEFIFQITLCRLRHSDSFLSVSGRPENSRYLGEPFDRIFKSHIPVDSTPMRHSTSSTLPVTPIRTDSARHSAHPSQLSSKFWRNRLGRRDMTSVLSSPKCLSLFS